METAARELAKALLQVLYAEGLLKGETWEKARLEAERVPVRLPGEGGRAKSVDDP